MTPGRYYHIVYRIPGVHNKPREAVFRFLSEDATEYHFDARPQAGTQTIGREFVSDIQETQGPVSMPRIWKGG